MMDLIGNHLWQSTLCAGVAALLTLLFRKNHARVRYALWVSASIKFLTPLSLLIAVGASIDFVRPEAPSVTPDTVWYVQSISRPFESPLGSPAPTTALAPSVVAQSNCAHVIATVLWAAWGCGFVVVLLRYLLKWRRVANMVRASAPLTDCRAYAALQALCAAGGCRTRIRLASSSSSMEPGVFGIFRPVLLLPQGILDRLGDGELEAIIAHEIAHVRRRDNLMAAIHMFVEALFWFHPMVWWLGGMLVRERENACDEAVLKLGKNPQAYAEGILKVCEFYLESPLECVAGVTGADMKKRIHAIMTLRIGRRLGTAQRLVLAMAGLGALTAPIAVGLLDVSAIQAMPKSVPKLLSAARSMAAPAASAGQMELGRKQSTDSTELSIGSSPATADMEKTPVSSPNQASASKPSFEVASIRPAKFRDCMKQVTLSSGEKRWDLRYSGIEPGGRFSGCRTLKLFMAYAYGSIDFYGEPDWIQDAIYEIEAKAEGDPRPEEMKLMLQSLLEERFGLRVHRQIKEVDSYSLVVAKGGHKLKEARDEYGKPIVALPNLSTEERLSGKYVMNSDQNQVEFRLPPNDLQYMAYLLRSPAGRVVVDKTGLSGFFEVNLRFAPRLSMPAKPESSGTTPAELAPQAPAAPSLFTAVEEQLGLKLVPDKVSMEVLIVDSIGKLKEN